MRKQIMTAPKTIAFVDAPIPEISDDQVLLRIEKIGVCGSDIHVYHGQHPFTKYPVTQGHECSGYVEKVGKNVTHVKPGDKVAIEPQEVCGECRPCRDGKYNLCEKLKVMGFQCLGTGAEYFACDKIRAPKLPDDFSMDDGCMLEPLAVAVHAVGQAGDVSGKDIVVIGAGPIGNLVAQVAKGLGARRVMVTDVSDLRLQLAKECGADFAVNTRGRDFTEAIVSAFGPDRADIIYDCAGNNTTINQAIYAARRLDDIARGRVRRHGGGRPRRAQRQGAQPQHDDDVSARALPEGDRARRRGKGPPQAAPVDPLPVRTVGGRVPLHRRPPRDDDEGHHRRAEVGFTRRTSRGRGFRRREVFDPEIPRAVLLSSVCSDIMIFRLQRIREGFKS